MTLLLIALLLFSPFQKQQITHPVPPTEDKATIYLYSYKHTRTLGRVTGDIYLKDDKSDKLIAKLDGARYFILRLPAGTYAFHFKEKKRGGISMNFEAGKIYYIRQEMREGVTVGINGLVLMPAESGSYDIQQMKPTEKRDIRDSRIETQ